MIFDSIEIQHIVKAYYPLFRQSEILFFFPCQCIEATPSWEGQLVSSCSQIIFGWPASRTLRKALALSYYLLCHCLFWELIY